MKKYLLAALLVLTCQALWGQGRIYTRKARLEDFPSKTTKVVLTGHPLLDAVVREEVASRWRVSPFEFCTVNEYQRLRAGDLHYFLRFAQDGDFTYMVLTKGGYSEDPDQLKQGFDVVMLPVAGADVQGAATLVHMDAFVDIIQEFITRAQESESVAYRGLKAICTGNKGGEQTVLEIAPSMRATKKGWRIAFTKDTHQLCSIRKYRYRK